MRTVVVGASSGLGRCIATGLAKRGDQLVVMARRQEQLGEAAEEAGAGTVAVTCDVTDSESCQAAVEQAITCLGGIDAVVYATGVGYLNWLVDTDAAMWRHMLETNVMGASLFTAAALPHLKASNGLAVYLSSVSGSLTPPWPGLGAYSVSKAALDKLVDAWRVEHPSVGFTRVVVGDCAGGDGDSMTQFANNWDFEFLAELHPIWTASHYLAGSLLDVETLVDAVHHVLQAGPTASLPVVAVVPRPPATS